MRKPTSTLIAALAVALSPFMLLTSAQAQDSQAKAKSNQYWWPEQLDLSPLRRPNPESDPRDADFSYAEQVEELDYAALKKDLKDMMTTSRDWWPADYGHYGPFFIRMSWHATGTYRMRDGRGGVGGGQQRFDPLNSWPDNANLDKARRLLWSIKQDYGDKISWSDLLALAGTVAMEDMGFETLGFALGRTDDWEPDQVYWGPESEMLAGERYEGGHDLERPFGATQMGLIYVNPEGPKGEPDPLAAAKATRETFGRMAMNDEETLALIAGGHTFGKAHGANKAEDCVGREPAAADMEEQGLGWKNKCGKGKAEDTYTSGLEGAWTASPAKWTQQYLQNLFSFEWKKTESPAGKTQWEPKAESASNMVPDAHVEGKRHAPMMFTTDIALKRDPEYRKIAKRFMENPEAFEQAYARAWFKLTHRDMGPRSRYMGPAVPEQKFAFQDLLPEADYKTVGSGDIESLKSDIKESDLGVQELVRVAWASASSYRDTDKRGGANGARVRLEPQKNWAVNNPEELDRVLSRLDDIRQDFNESQRSNKKVSLADMIVFGGAAAIEKAAARAGNDITVPVKPGRVDATAKMTDADSFDVLKPDADAFRNYYSSEADDSPTAEMVEKANSMGLTVPEMTVLIGGMRALDANAEDVDHGVLTDEPGTLTNDFFVNVLDMSTKWEKAKDQEGLYVGRDRETGERQWTATPVDLIYVSNAELRAVTQYYATDDAQRKFLDDFVDAWVKVMQADRFDLKH
ncbi:catalase/peroxidase HPI [Thiohalorhabdus sp.]|uniref:catalase/peroxidase HPI n=1 Tax=Thiohalorhabdus sp. TaxID=3094134 RepID=UPI002FC335C9